jgi:hypothetical protein
MEHMQLFKHNSKECKMKRLMPVLAIALVLILCSWDSAESRRSPRLTIDDVSYDHPWGGEQNDPLSPVDHATAVSLKGGFSFIDIIKAANYRFLFNGSTFMFSGSKTRTATPPPIDNTTTTTETNTNSNQSSSGRGR